jgi:hypothetical protein
MIGAVLGMLILALRWPFGASAEQQQLDATIAHERVGVPTALALVQARSDAKDLHYRSGMWAVEPDIEHATQAYPIYCPGEYLVWIRGDNDAPMEHVDIRTRRIIRLNSINGAVDDWMRNRYEHLVDQGPCVV